jgi:hypothetical protein
MGARLVWVIAVAACSSPAHPNRASPQPSSVSIELAAGDEGEDEVEARVAAYLAQDPIAMAQAAAKAAREALEADVVRCDQTMMENHPRCRELRGLLEKAKKRERELSQQIGGGTATIEGYVDSLAISDPPARAAACPAPRAPALVACAGADTPQAPTTRIDQCLAHLLPDLTLATPSEGGLRLTAKGARLAVASSKSDELDVILLERNELVARLVAAAAVAETRGAPLAPAQARDVATACEQTLAWLDRATTLSADSAIALTCLVRAAAGISDAPLAASWGDCPCGERGEQLGETCFESTATSRVFRDTPIDARIPAMLSKAIERANLALVGTSITIESVGVTGCHFPRLERGGTMRALDQQTAPVFSMRLVSNHSAATACDLSRVWTSHGGMSIEMLYWSLLDPVGNRRITERRELKDALLATVRDAGGEGPWFRAARSTATQHVLGRARTVGIALRNALVDAGFLVYSPLTNGAHRDHLHIALPRTPLAPDADSTQREQLLADELARAAGR